MPALLRYTVAKQLCWSSGLKQLIKGSILVNFIIIKQRNLKIYIMKLAVYDSKSISYFLLQTDILSLSNLKCTKTFSSCSKQK